MKRFVIVALLALALGGFGGFGKSHGCTHTLESGTVHPVHVWICVGQPISLPPVGPS